MRFIFSGDQSVGMDIEPAKLIGITRQNRQRISGETSKERNLTDGRRGEVCDEESVYAV